MIEISTRVELASFVNSLWPELGLGVVASIPPFAAGYLLKVLGDRHNTALGRRTEQLNNIRQASIDLIKTCRQIFEIMMALEGRGEDAEKIVDKARQRINAEPFMGKYSPSKSGMADQLGSLDQELQNLITRSEDSISQLILVAPELVSNATRLRLHSLSRISRIPDRERREEFDWYMNNFAKEARQESYGKNKQLWRHKQLRHYNRILKRPPTELARGAMKIER